ncbi:MAG: hypothetical protein ACRDWF_10460 [Acidimicrobiia bacterium]
MPSGVRNLFRAALVIFVITVVIGILNGTDVWEPPRNTLLTHVHAGTLGWLTLSIFAGAILMFGSPEDRSSNAVANFSIVALNATLKRIFTPILGLSLLYGIYTYLTAKEARPAVTEEVGV